MAQSDERCSFTIVLKDGQIVKAPEEIAATILQIFSVKAKSQINHAQDSPSVTVLSVPLWFKEEQKVALYEAAKQAGLELVATIESPVARVKAYGLDTLAYLD